MRRILSLLLVSALLLPLLSACQQQPVTESDPPPSTTVDEPSAQELVDAVFPFSGCDKALETEALDVDAVTVYLENAYGLDESACTDAAIIRGMGMSAFEITVLRLSGEDAATSAVDHLKDYVHTREADFTGYAPAEADMVSNGRIRQEGTWLGLFICPDPEGAETAFQQALNGTVMIPNVLPDSVTNMESMKDALVYQCRDELTELGGYRVSMFGSTEDFPQQMEDTYGVPANQLTDGFVIHGPEGSFFEVAVLRMADQEAADQCFMDDLLSTYVDRVAEPLFTLYEDGTRNIEDEDLELYKYIARNSRIQSSEFLALLICEDPQGTTKQLLTAITSLHQSEKSQMVPRPDMKDLNPEGTPTFLETNWKEPEGEPDPNHPGRLKYTQPNEEDMSIYDTSAILAAWAASDPSPLSDYDREIYDAAKVVLDEVLTDGMSDYDKEVAIYAWIVKNVDYDYTYVDPLTEGSRDTYGPYGGLVNHSAVCLGYSTVFQLLADLAGLECITVVGAGSGSRMDHAWNMVRLDGNWYCLDATWDASAREQDDEHYGSGWVWRFFNVTSDYMARTNHQWDYDIIPEAVTEGHGQR